MTALIFRGGSLHTTPIHLFNNGDKRLPPFPLQKKIKKLTQKEYIAPASCLVMFYRSGFIQLVLHSTPVIFCKLMYIGHTIMVLQFLDIKLLLSSSLTKIIINDFAAEIMHCCHISSALCRQIANHAQRKQKSHGFHILFCVETLPSWIILVKNYNK